jgi:hypothetical protein
MNTRCGFILGVALLLFVHMARADTVDLNITAEKHRVEGSDTDERAKGEYGGSKQTEQWKYTVTIENQAFKPLANLQVKYIIYYKRDKLGSKGPPTTETKAGSVNIDSLDSSGSTSFDTDPVTLISESLLDEYYPNGAPPKAADTLEGIWIRVYQDGNQVSEYTYPTDLSSNEQWK